MERASKGRARRSVTAFRGHSRRRFARRRPSRGGRGPVTVTRDKSGLRTSALVVTNGVTVHNGAYSYDAAGRLAQCVDSATNPPTTEVYVWNPDSTLASYPFAGATVAATYDEEYRLTALASGGLAAYQYGYAFDNGRRWKKDIANNIWTWFPCGVQCNAGDLVEETSDLTGQSWAVSATYLRGTGCGGGEIYHRNGEWSSYDVTGTAGVILNGSGAISNSNLYDAFNVLRYVVSGSAQTQWRWLGGFQEEEGLVARAGGSWDELAGRGTRLTRKHDGRAAGGPASAPRILQPTPTLDCLNACMKVIRDFNFCATLCLAWRTNGCEWFWETCEALARAGEHWMAEACFEAYLAVCWGE